MKSKFIFLSLCVIALIAGCSPSAWRAYYHMAKAENAATKAYEMRRIKGPYENRLKLYRKACADFTTAHKINPRVFTLTRIQLAWDACHRIADFKNQQIFEEFEAKYAAEHPTETEYGDAFPALEG